MLNKLLKIIKALEEEKLNLIETLREDKQKVISRIMNTDTEGIIELYDYTYFKKMIRTAKEIEQINVRLNVYNHIMEITLKEFD